MTKKILVTGATRGIGRKIFEEMLSVGEVFGLARNSEKLEELKTLGAKNIFLSHCSPMVINQIILDAFKDIFDIKVISTPRDDMAIIER